MKVWNHDFIFLPYFLISPAPSSNWFQSSQGVKQFSFIFVSFPTTTSNFSKVKTNSTKYKVYTHAVSEWAFSYTQLAGYKRFKNSPGYK